MKKILYVSISIFSSIAVFMSVYFLFDLFSREINIPLYIQYDTPISVGGGRSSYEEDGSGTALGSIATYFSCLAAYFTFNTILHIGLSWFSNLIRLNVIFITVGVLIQFVPLIITSLIFMEISTIPGYVESIINISIEISLLYINWKYTYHLYSRKKSKLNGYKLWAALSSNGRHYMIVEAKSNQDAFEIVQENAFHFDGTKLKLKNVRACAVKKNLLLQCNTSVASRYVEANCVILKDTL